MRLRRPSPVSLMVSGSALFLTLADQITKWLATEHLSPFDPVEIIPGFFQLVLVHNPGAAFGIMRNVPNPWRMMVFSVMYILAIAIIINMYIHRPQNSRLIPISIALISGGAFGNFIDRYRYGYVVDFIDTFPLGYHFPTFNIADSCITIGVTLMIIYMFFFDKEHSHAS